MKDALMTFRVDSQLRDEFMEAVEKNHLPAAQVLRDLMRRYVNYVEPPPAPALSDAETRRRRDAANFARANVGLEGFKITAAEEQWTERFIRGEITMDEFIKGN